MSSHNKSSPLGDLRAEFDHRMLEKVFYASPDFRTIIEDFDRTIVIGRRGTGKSALFYKLSQFWSKNPKSQVIEIAPEEHDMMTVRSFLPAFGNKFAIVRAGARVAWRYGFLLEIANNVSASYRFKDCKSFPFLDQHLRIWRKSGLNIYQRLRTLISQHNVAEKRPEEIIAQLAAAFDLSNLESAVKDALFETKVSVFILADRLDEGYEPDHLGIGLVDGFIKGSVNSIVIFCVKGIRPVYCIFAFLGGGCRAAATPAPAFVWNFGAAGRAKFQAAESSRARPHSHLTCLLAQASVVAARPCPPTKK